MIGSEGQKTEEQTKPMADSEQRSVKEKIRRCLRTLWRQGVQQQWRSYRWFLLGALWLAVLLLGYVGFAQFFEERGEPHTPQDLFYLSLQLFVLESGSVVGAKSWALDVARFLAPLVAAYTAIQAIFLVFYEQLQLVQVRFMHNHVVICGLGRKGYLLTREFRGRGDQVLVIDRDRDNDLIDPCRQLGAIVLVGNLADREILHQARVQKARTILSVAGDDGTNAQVAIHAYQLVHSDSARGKRQSTPLTCIVHIIDPELCDLLREREIEDEHPQSFRLHFFNVYERGAWALLDEYPAFDPQGDDNHLLVIGLGHLGDSLVVNAAKLWLDRYHATDQRLPITIVDLEAQRQVASLCLRYPRLGEICDLNPLDLDVRWPEFRQAQFLFDDEGQCKTTGAYVCLDDDSLALSAALILNHKLREHNVPIVARLERSAGLARLLQSSKSISNGYGHLHGFGLLDRTCQLDMVLGGAHEIIARAIHQEYLCRHQARDLVSPTVEALVPWEQLAEEYRESCRRQADHVGLKLQAIGCQITILTDWEAELPTFTPEEVEQMAQMEHDRWLTEHQQAGWHPGPKDPARKTNPYLVPWRELPEEIRQLNRDMVSGLPAFLARRDSRSTV